MQTIKDISCMWKNLLALFSICIGFTVVALCFMSVYYDGRVDEMHKAHRAEISAERGRNTREKNQQRGEVVDKLDRIERLIISSGRSN